jgi:protein-L-isoaspartate(D-aspartate) O-methyltransferase
MNNMGKYIKLLICSLMIASFMIQSIIIEAMAKDIELQNNANSQNYIAKSANSSNISPYASNDLSNEIRKNMSQEREQMIGRLMGRISNRTISAMMSVPRELFVPADQRPQAYDDTPLPIGFGQTISSPDIVAEMCDLLDLQEGMSVLDIGGGSGYHAAVMADMVGPKGQVYSIERIHEIAVQEKENLKQAGVTNVMVIEGDGSLGLPKYAPYDRINAAACAPQIPEALKQQLKIGGKMILPVGGIVQALCLVTKTGENSYVIDDKKRVAFVPLIGDYGFKEEVLK